MQTGDYTDRGTDVRKVMDLLMRLEQEAKSAGGQAIVRRQSRNHERHRRSPRRHARNLRDVRDADVEAVREDAWKQYERVARRAPR